ncbi:MAG: hypothetical protein ACK50A_12330 [Sphingobacteriaceae bacterium]
MIKRTIIVFSCLVVLASCSKTRTCECSNSNGKYIAFEYDETKRKAKKTCEGLNTNDTKCELK